MSLLLVYTGIWHRRFQRNLKRDDFSPPRPTAEHEVRPRRERAAIFSYLINSYFSRCLCRTGAAAASVPVEEEERLLLLENPEDLPSNEMLSRSSELSCQKKATQWRKARQPAQSERQIATPTPHTLITFWEPLRQITAWSCLAHTNRNLLLPLSTRYIICCLL